MNLVIPVVNGVVVFGVLAVAAVAGFTGVVVWALVGLVAGLLCAAVGHGIWTRHRGGHG